VSASTYFTRVVTREKERPEDSIGLRVVVAAMVMVALVAVIAQGTTNTFTWIGGLLLVPVGYAFSYFQRDKANVGTKVVLVVGLLAALGGFLQNVRFAQSVDQARIPLASLFVWVQVLHSFDVPRRRDLSFSVVSSLILMAEAGALSLGTGFLVYLVPWSALAAMWLYLSQRPARDEVSEPAFVRKVRVSDRRTGVAAGRSLALATTAVLTAVVVVFMLTPRLPGAFVRLPPFAVRTAISVPGFQGQVVNPGLPSGGGDGGVVDFSPSVYPGFGSNVDLRARGRLSDAVVMRVRSPQAALWRGQAYDAYDGTTWTASDTGTLEVGQDFEQSFQVPSGSSDVPTRRIVTTFYVQANQPNIVFAAYIPEQVYFPAPVLTVDRYDSIHSPILLDPGLIYSVVSTIPITTPTVLRGAPAVWNKAEANQYTQLPPDLPERDVALAKRITASAPTTYGKVMAVQDWLHRNTRYNLDVPRDPPGVDAVDEFLFVRRQGFCEHIASAMAVLLRAVGIPTRLVTGFGPGERNPFTGYYDVRQSDAHAWVEVLYPGVGWVQYDPTFGVPAAAPGLGGRFIAPEVIRAIGRFIAQVTPEPLKAVAREAGSAIGSAARGTLASWPLSVGFAGLVVAAALLFRRRRTVRARGAPPSGAARAFIALSETLRDRGHPRAEHQTPTEFLRGIERDGALPHDLLGDAEVVVRTFEGERYAGRTPDDEEVEGALAAASRVRERAPAKASGFR
jgi:transglutaminase-like putative cysteine protease